MALAESFVVGGTDDDEHNAAGPMAFGINGTLYVAAHDGFSDPPFPHVATLIHIDPSTGNEINRLNRQITNGVCQAGAGPECTAGARVFLTTDQEPGMADSALAIDSAGNVYYGGPDGIWSFSSDLQTQRWTRPLIPRAFAVDSANGALYITGVGVGGGTLYNMLVARLSTSTGVTAWTFSTTSESQSVPYSNDPNFVFQDDRVYGGNKIALDSTGQIYAAGSGTDGAYHGGIVEKFNSSGPPRQWIQHYGPSGSAAAVFALTIDNVNDVYVAGQEVVAGPSNFTAPPMVIMSPVDGSQLWSQRMSSVLPGTGFSFDGIGNVGVDGNGTTYWKDTAQNSDGGFGDIWIFKGSAVPSGTYTIVGLNSGMAVDDPGFSGSAGTQMEQFTVNNGSNQKWAVTNLGNNVIRLVNQSSGLSLGVRSGSTSNGAAVEQNVWTGATSQQWSVSSGTPGYFILTNVKSLQLLDVTGASKVAGTLLDQWPANNGANQKWHFQ